LHPHGGRPSDAWRCVDRVLLEPTRPPPLPVNFLSALYARENSSSPSFALRPARSPSPISLSPILSGEHGCVICILYPAREATEKTVRGGGRGRPAAPASGRRADGRAGDRVLQVLSAYLLQAAAATCGRRRATRGVYYVHQAALLQAVAASATFVRRRCYKRRRRLLPKACGAATSDGGICYVHPVALLQEVAASATKG
jgi:hypothetical protein